MEPDEKTAGLTWPGYMLDKMRLYLDSDCTADPSNSVFHRNNRVPQSYPGYDNDLNNWRVSDAGYLLQGQLRDPKKSYTSNNLQAKFEPSYNSTNHFLHKKTDGLTMHTKHS